MGDSSANLSAGRELDALIAEKIFGLILKDRFTGEEKPITSGMALRHMEKWHNIPYYSTDIAAAWTVVEKIKSKDRAIFFELVNSVNYKWECQIGGGNAEADTAPHAICLAALKAVEGK